MIAIDKSVEGFYTKNPEENYAGTYDAHHGPRLDDLIRHFGLSEMKNKRVLDIGGGLGFLGKRLDYSNDYWVIDGAKISDDLKVSKGTWYQADLDYHKFGSEDGDNCLIRRNAWPWDVAFCLEVLEHLGNPHHALVEIKNLVKRDGDIYISIPPPEVWHNTPYPTLLWPKEHFILFLAQMALPVLEFYEYKPKNIGWPAWNFKCRNADWRESKMVFHKDEAKFRGITPLQATNL